MSELEENPAGRKCPQCGAELPGNVPPELCPKCLLKTGLGTQPVMGANGTVALPPREAKSRGLPQPGDRFGHYRIIRLLGQGGMGAAFEADDLDTGRCVALKVLSHTLDSPDARERFFREGRLAASINHPNSVYVFGTEEIAGTLPPVLALDRVWLTGDGRAKLLEFPAPGVALDSPVRSSPFTRPEPPEGGTPNIAPPLPDKDQTQHFLAQVAAAALAGQADAPAQPASDVAVPLPLHARTFLKHLPQLFDTDAVLNALKPLLTRVAEVSRLRRAAVVGGCLVFPAMAGIGLFFGSTMWDQWQRRNPGLMELSQLLQQRSAMRFWARNNRGPTDRQLAIYTASHYRDAITNETIWSSTFTLAMIKGESRRFAEKSLVEHPAPTETEMAEADRAVKPYLPKQNVFAVMQQPWFPLAAVVLTLGFYVGLPALIAALAFRGGLVLLVAGVTFVRKDGGRASRLRVFWRGLVAWGSLGMVILVAWVSLCVVAGVVAGLRPTLSLPLSVWGLAWALVSMLLICVLTILSIALPKRGLPDRLAGTWPVPR